MIKKNRLKNIILTALLGALFLMPVLSVYGGIQEEIDARNQQIEQIQREIEEYQKQIDTFGDKARTLSSEISRLNSRISQLQLEIRSLGLSIEQTTTEISETRRQIDITKQQLEVQKNALGRYIVILDQYDRENLATILMKNNRLSSFFDNLKNIQDTQNKARASIIFIKELKIDLENKEITLGDKREELEKLRLLQESQKNSLGIDKSYKDKLLKETKGEETRYQKLVKDSKQAIQRIKEQIFYLQQNGISVEDAIKYGKIAADRVGIRQAFLIAILEVESGLGKNVGTGNWLNDMYKCYQKLGKPSRAEAEKTAFMEIVNKLGLNPDTVKVSREPNYGCGGALGPAQFLPTTWLAYEDEVVRLTGAAVANPWNIEHAFIASAAKLARGGATAKTKAAETAAAKAYFSGNSKCSTAACNSYVRAVLNKAAAIEPDL